MDSNMQKQKCEDGANKLTLNSNFNPELKNDEFGSNEIKNTEVSLNNSSSSVNANKNEVNPLEEQNEVIKDIATNSTHTEAIGSLKKLEVDEVSSDTGTKLSSETDQKIASSSSLNIKPMSDYISNSDNNFKIISNSLLKAKQDIVKTPPSNSRFLPKLLTKRPGIGSLVSNLNKKPKMGILEKSKLDWNEFKKSEKLEEELSQFNRGKRGYLEQQDFLKRTDLRQFEIEKELRLSRRKN